MPGAVDLYYELTHAPDEESRARLIANALERVESRFAALDEVATRTDLSETELRLQREIEQLRREMHEIDGRTQTQLKEMDGRIQAQLKEMDGRIQAQLKEMDGRLQQEIEQLRTEMHEIDGRTQTQLKEMDGRLQRELEQLRAEMSATKGEIIKWTAGMLVLLFGALLSSIAALLTQLG